MKLHWEWISLLCPWKWHITNRRYEIKCVPVHIGESSLRLLRLVFSAAHFRWHHWSYILNPNVNRAIDTARRGSLWRSSSPALSRSQIYSCPRHLRNLFPLNFLSRCSSFFHFSEPHSESRNSALAGSLSFSISGEKNKDGVVEKKCRVYSSASALSTTGSFTGTAVVYGCGLGWDTYGTHNEFLKVTYYNFDQFEDSIQVLVTFYTSIELLH